MDHGYAFFSKEKSYSWEKYIEKFVEYLCPDIKWYKCRKYGILEEREEGTPADVSRYKQNILKILPLPANQNIAQERNPSVLSNFMPYIYALNL